MRSWLQAPAAPYVFGLMVLTGLALFGIAIGALMLEPSKALGDRLAELTCLQVAFTPERYARFFLAFSVEARESIRALLVPGDVVFAWGYGLLLAGLTGLVVIRLPVQWQVVGAWVLWAPLVASLFDCIEDTFLYLAAGVLLADPTGALPAGWPLIAGIAATLKYVALAVVTPVFGIAAVACGLSVDRRLGSLVLYAGLALLLLMMVLRPAQQIPPCF